MRLDLSADPWGAAMLGAAGIAVLGLVIVTLALAMGTTKRGGAWILGLGLLAFLGTSVLGTLARVREGDAAAKTHVPAAEPVKIIAPAVPPDPESEPPVGDSDGEGATAGPDPATPTDVAEPAPPPDPVPPEAAAEPGPSSDAPLPAPAPSAGAIALGSAPALPEDPAARRDAVIDRLHDAKLVALDDASCRDPETIAKTWVGIAAIPADVVPDRVAVIVRRLERCRRKIVGLRAWQLRRDRTAARKAFTDTLRERLAGDHPGIWVATSGKDAERLRAGAKSLDVSTSEALLAGGLKAELETLGFSSALFSDGTKNNPVELQASTDAAVLDAELAPLGLQEPFPEPKP